MSRIRIPLPREFAFVPTVVSHGWYQLAPFRWMAADAVLERTEVLGGEAVDLRISADADALIVSAAPALKPHAAELATKLGRMFQLGLDLGDFIARTRRSPVHGWVEAAGFGRLLCGATLFEDAVKIIATTNTTWRQTVRMTELLVEKCGRRSPAGRAAFPEPADVARFTPDELQLDCRLGYRAKSIHALAAGIAGGEIDLDALQNEAGQIESSAAVFKMYGKLPGIGPYGAAHLLAMDGRHDFIAVDSEFRRFVRERYHGGRKVSDQAMLRRYARWGRWKYLAFWAELWEGVTDKVQAQRKTSN